ncbi:hypothetical protein EW026_g4146 [Hermanssonia centrifuga]|uniref:Ribosomal RNA methyltransferase FtsJ domain-containing protein n=1 Tax=Hermanssonia centrifuga TaxID=98765 RepID=A0A4S4KI20_9APHY|nr:hypothetical protein EW026_g4146 [Hermanssonia centrifuga]
MSISDGYTSPVNPESFPDDNLLSHLLQKGVPELKRLVDLRKRGWEDDSLDNHFKRQRTVADTVDDKMNVIWFKKMKKAFSELNKAAHFVPRSGTLKFLDLGCSPGGFSSYVLSNNNKDATGIGISLPPVQGGHHFLLEKHFMRRYELIPADILEYNLGPAQTEIGTAEMRPLPSEIGGRDLVILDGHYLRTYLPASSESPNEWDRHRLLISQLIIALRSIKLGGSLVMKLSHPEHIQTAQLLFLLDVLSKDLRTFKPRTIHANRGTFYAIAQGVGLGTQSARQAEYLCDLEALWYEISFGGENGRGRFLTRNDMDFIVSQESLVSEYAKRLIELGMDAWIVQGDALYQWFSKKGLV